MFISAYLEDETGDIVESSVYSAHRMCLFCLQYVPVS